MSGVLATSELPCPAVHGPARSARGAAPPVASSTAEWGYCSCHIRSNGRSLALAGRRAMRADDITEPRWDEPPGPERDGDEPPSSIPPDHTGVRND